MIENLDGKQICNDSFESIPYAPDRYLFGIQARRLVKTVDAITHPYFDRLTAVCKKSSSLSRVVVIDTSHPKCSFHILQIIYAIFGIFISIFPKSWRKANRETIQNALFKPFGRERVIRASKLCGIEIMNMYTWGVHLKQRDLRKLMIALSAVNEKDLRDLYEYIQNPKLENASSIFEFLFDSKEVPEEFTEFFKSAGSFTAFDELNYDQQRVLLELCCPMNLRHMSLGAYPDRFPSVGFDRGYTTEGFYRVLTRLTGAGNIDGKVMSSTTVFNDSQIVKQIIGPHTPVGTLIPGHSGFYRVERQFRGGGAYAAYLRALGPNETHKDLLCFMPTQSFGPIEAGFKWAPMLDDLQVGIGAIGAKSVWKEIVDYLKEQTFATQKSPHFRLVAFSLGGAQAQLFLTLLAGHFVEGVKNDYDDDYYKLSSQLPVDEVLLFGSPGVERATSDAFMELCSRENITIPHFINVRDTGDDTPTVGEVTCLASPEKCPDKVSYYYVTHSNQQLHEIDLWRYKPGNLFDRTLRLWDAIQGPHGNDPIALSATMHRLIEPESNDDHIRLLNMFWDHTSHFYSNNERTRQQVVKGVFSHASQHLNILHELFPTAYPALSDDDSTNSTAG